MNLLLLLSQAAVTSNTHQAERSTLKRRKRSAFDATITVIWVGVSLFFFFSGARYFPTRDKGNYVGGVAIDSLWPGLGYLEALEEN